jgi:hypothetical protein
MPKPLKSERFAEAGRSVEQAEALNRMFKGMPVRDATGNMLISVVPADEVGAKPRDATDCVYAKACKRMYDSSAVLFFKRVVYVDLPEEDGTRVVRRFFASSKMTNAITEYDKTGTFKAGTYLLTAPGKGRSLEAHRKSSHRRRKMRTAEARERIRVKDRTRRARIKSKAYYTKTVSSAAAAGFVRSGTGLVQTRVI